MLWIGIACRQIHCIQSINEMYEDAVGRERLIFQLSQLARYVVQRQNELTDPIKLSVERFISFSRSKANS